MKSILLIVLSVMVGFAQVARGQEKEHQHDRRAEGLNKRGDHAMGFSHEKTEHHFRLTASGGLIEVRARDAADSTSAEQIRAHLAHIAELFSEGDFSKPMFIHGETPPGVATMKRLRADITYTFETIEGGGRVRIAGANHEVTQAIHDFLRYQIKDHRTGDPLEPTNEK